MIDQKLDLILVELKEIKAVQASHGDLLKSHDEQLKIQGEQLKSQGEQLKSHSQQFKEIREQLTSHDQQFKEIKEQLNEQSEQLRSHNVQLNSHGEHIQQLIHIVAATNTKVEELTDHMNQVREDVSVFKTNQQTVLQTQQEHEKILERLSIRSVAHEADIAELRRAK